MLGKKQAAGKSCLVVILLGEHRWQYQHHLGEVIPKLFGPGAIMSRVRLI